MNKTSALCILGFLPLALSAALSGAAIERFFPEFKDYRFVLEQERTEPASTAKESPFSEGILAEGGLQSFSVWRLTQPSGRRVRLKVFEMADSAGSYSLFNAWTSKPEAPLPSLDLPVGNRYSGSEAAFWRGNFFLLVEPLTGLLSENDFESLVQQVFAAVNVENLLPVSVSHFPPDQLVPESIRFYLGPVGLAVNDRFPEPLLDEIGIAERIEVAFGRYEPGDDALFLIGYPTPALAKDYSDRLQDRLKDFFSSEGIYMKRAGVLVCLFVGPEDRALDILPKVKYAPTIQWLYEKEPEGLGSETLNFLGLITKTILGTGTFILMILATGTVVGLIRYQILRKYPGISKRKEMVRLHLDD